jgi:hypothetical protein
LDWLPSITTTTVLGLALWLGRKLIATRLTKSVEHEFNTKLESLRAELRKNEELFKADLRSKETEIEALRSGAMAAMASRQIALDKRRLDAADQLWAAFTALGPAKGISMIMAAVNFEATAKLAVKDARVREMFTGIGGDFDLKKIDFSHSAKARPHVSPMVWALFCTYQAIVVLAVVKLQIIKLGIDVDPKKLIDKDVTTNLIKAALPHHSEYIDQVGEAGYHYLLEELEVRLLDELRKMLEGVEADKTSVEQAAKIVKLSNELLESSKKGMSPTTALMAEGSDIPRP